MKYINKIKISLIALLAAAIVLPVFALFVVAPVSAAGTGSMYFSPNSASYQSGRTFSVNVMLSATEAANAVSGNIAFDTSLLEVTGLSKSGSRIGVWVREPSFSNGSGSISFEGIIPNPGYTGNGAKIIGITFRTKGSGSAGVRFTGGKVLANDGYGTNMTGGLGSARYTVGDAAEQPATTGLPAAPRIQSDTHPDSNVWYNNNQPQFKWALPNGVTAVSAAVTDSPTGDPGNASGLATSLSLKDRKNGISYLHVKFRNRQGWGPVSHYKFQIDTEPPSQIDLQKQDSGYLITAKDQFSGIDHYEWQTEDKEPVRLEEKEGYYHFVGLAAGEHQITLKAFDKAGNSAEKVVSVIGEGEIEQKPQEKHVFQFNYSWPIAAFGLFLLVLLGLLYYQTGHLPLNMLSVFGAARTKRQEKPDNSVFLALADEMLEQIKILEHAKAQRKLTPEETKLLKHIHSSLQKVEKLITPRD